MAVTLPVVHPKWQLWALANRVAVLCSFGKWGMGSQEALPNMSSEILNSEKCTACGVCSYSSQTVMNLLNQLLRTEVVSLVRNTI